MKRVFELDDLGWIDAPLITKGYSTFYQRVAWLRTLLARRRRANVAAVNNVVTLNRE